MLADDVGLWRQKALRDARSENDKNRYQHNIQEALEIDAFGLPCYLLDGEVFWGQDRNELLDDRIDIRPQSLSQRHLTFLIGNSGAEFVGAS